MMNPNYVGVVIDDVWCLARKQFLAEQPAVQSTIAVLGYFCSKLVCM